MAGLVVRIGRFRALIAVLVLAAAVLGIAAAAIRGAAPVAVYLPGAERP